MDAPKAVQFKKKWYKFYLKRLGKKKEREIKPKVNTKKGITNSQNNWNRKKDNREN